METKKPKRVIAKKSLIVKRMKEHKKVKMYPVPDFRMKEGDVIPYFKVRMASLDDQIHARELSNRSYRTLVKFLELYKNKKLNDMHYQEFLNTLYHDDMNPKTIQICNIFHRCVLSPKFELGEVMELAETHPSLVNDVAAFALGGEIEERKDGN